MARYRPNQLVRISPRTFDQIDEYIRDAEVAKRNVQLGMNALTMLMARANQGIAQEISRGPVDPHQQMANAAWKIPVRRISSRYYKGWKVKRLAPGVWMLYNDTREAYFIEYGINHVGGGFEVKYRDGRTYIKGSNRVRRPIRKLSLIRTMRFVDQSRAGERVWQSIFGPFRHRPGRIQTTSEAAILDEVQSQIGMRYL